MQKQCHGDYKLFLPLVVSIQANPPLFKMRRYYMAGNDRHRKIKSVKFPIRININVRKTVNKSYT